MASKKLITGELEFSPERIEADALNFVGSALYLLTVLHMQGHDWFVLLEAS